jgi:linoleoyl-CoA desaturase
MLGSANISGSRAMHLMTGNLSHQIEHHLFPDMPSNRYKEISPKIKDLFQRYGLSYTSGPLPKQVASAWWKVIRLSLPNRGEAAVRREVEKKAPAVSTRWRPVNAPTAAASTPAATTASS